MTRKNPRRNTKKVEEEEDKSPFNPDLFIKVSKAVPSSKKIKKQVYHQARNMVTNVNAVKFMTAGGFFLCPHCHNRAFEKAQALGGHMSKAHPNMSPDFTRKQQRRKERAGDRELLKRAKELYVREYGPTRHFVRNKLTAFKNILREQMSSTSTATENSQE